MFQYHNVLLKTQCTNQIENLAIQKVTLTNYYQ